MQKDLAPSGVERSLNSKSVMLSIRLVCLRGRAKKVVYNIAKWTREPLVRSGKFSNVEKERLNPVMIKIWRSSRKYASFLDFPS